MFAKTLLPDTVRAIKLVSDNPTIKNSYLVGGTALALQIGHRISVDLDFFTQEELEEDVLSINLSQLKEFAEEGKSWRTIWGKIGETKFSLFYYKYPLLAPKTPFSGINLASLQDVSAMKIHALASRGTKRDFIDLYFLKDLYSIDEMLEFYDRKYGDLDDKIYHIIRSFDYFDDAEVDPMPKMLKKVLWEDVKSYFHNLSMKQSKTRLGV